MSAHDPRDEITLPAAGAAEQPGRTAQPPSTDPGSEHQASPSLTLPPTSAGSAPVAAGEDHTIAFSDESALGARTRRLGDNGGLDGDEITGSFGDYSLVRKLASGGMGAVHLARQNSLHRMVALKTILAGQVATTEDIQRFHQEAELAAQLDHSGIVPIYEVGENAGRHYFSMAYIEGGSLADRIKDGPLPCRQAAVLVREVALALAYAHGQGVIHRDLKPSNVLLDRHGHPKITDFGLAKLVSGISHLTLTGQVMGTPSFMAPEQAAGKTDEIGPLADLYSLGAVLYCLITGRPPFQAATPVETLRLVLEQEPVSPRRLNAGVSQDVETITLKCLQKDPGKRYESAQSLADDLGRYLSGEPIRARPVGRVERLARWCARNRLVAALAGSFVLSLVAGVVVALFFAFQARREAAAARASEARAKEAQEWSERRWYAAEMGLAQQNWENGQPARLRSRLAALRPASNGATDLRGFEWYFLERLSRLELRTLSGHAEPVESVAFSPDGRLVASAGGQFKRGDAGALRIWDSTSGEAIHAWVGHAERVNCVVFSPDGKRLASAAGVSNGPGEVKLWDAQTGSEVLSLAGQTAQVWSLAFSPDGRRLAGGSGGFDDVGRSLPGDVLIWDLAGAAPVVRLRGHEAPVRSVAFSPDGRWLAAADNHGAVKIWNAAQGTEALRLEGHGGSVMCVAFSPDGRQLATGSLDEMIRVWDTSQWNTQGPKAAKPRFALRHRGTVHSVAFAPDGRRLATGCEDRSVRIWELSTQTEILTLFGHADEVSSVAFAPDGWRLASASRDQTVKIWDATSDRKTLRLHDHKEDSIAYSGIALSPDGRWLAGGGQDRVVRVWDTTSGLVTQTLHGAADYITSVAFSPDGRWLACGSEDRIVRVWDPATGRLVRSLEGFQFPIQGVAFAPNSRWLACAGGEWNKGVVLQVWDVITNREVFSPPAQSDTAGSRGFSSVAFSRDGLWLAAACYDSTVQIWNVSTRKPTALCRGHTAAARGVAFSPDSRYLASASDDRTVKLWEVATGKGIRTLSGHTAPVESVAFSPDGRRVVSGGSEPAVKLWDPRTGQEVFTLNLPFIRARVAFAPGGRQLAVGGSLDSPTDYTLAIWDARDPSPELKLHNEASSRVAFLFARALPAEKVREALANDTSVSAAVREKALALVDAFGQDLARREAEDEIQRLHADGLIQAQLLERIRTEKSLSEPVRRQALALAATWVDCAMHLDLASRAVVRRAGARAADYERAWKQAETACRLLPYRAEARITLGLAQYRVGKFAEAVDSLTRADQQSPVVSERWIAADLAFLAMAHWQLGAADRARGVLDRLRKLMQQPAWANDGEAKAFLHEAQELIRGT